MATGSIIQKNRRKQRKASSTHSGTQQSFLEIMRRAFYGGSAHITRPRVAVEVYFSLRQRGANISSSRPRWRLFVFAAFGKGWPGCHPAAPTVSPRQMSGRKMINWCEHCELLLSRVNLIKMIWRISIFPFSLTGPHTRPHVHRVGQVPLVDSEFKLVTPFIDVLLELKISEKGQRHSPLH